MKKLITVVLIIIATLISFLGCQSQKVFIGYKVSVITETKGDNITNKTYLIPIYWSDKLIEENPEEIQTSNHLIGENNFSPTKNSIYLYLPPHTTYTASLPNLHIYTLPYYNDGGMGSGITPIIGGAIATYDRDYVEIYKGNKKIFSGHLPTSANEITHFILGGVEKDGNIYMLWGYSDNNTENTYIELKNITKDKVIWQKEIPECFVSCQGNKYINNHTYTYLLCPKEKGKGVYLSFDPDFLSVNITNQEPKWEKDIMINNLHINVKGGLLYIGGKQVDGINSNYGFYIFPLGQTK